MKKSEIIVNILKLLFFGAIGAYAGASLGSDLYERKAIKNHEHYRDRFGRINCYIPEDFGFEGINGRYIVSTDEQIEELERIRGSKEKSDKE